VPESSRVAMRGRARGGRPAVVPAEPEPEGQKITASIPVRAGCELRDCQLRPGSRLAAPAALARRRPVTSSFSGFSRSVRFTSVVVEGRAGSAAPRSGRRTPLYEHLPRPPLTSVTTVLGFDFGGVVQSCS
jgi:hypothetical protein